PTDSASTSPTSSALQSTSPTALRCRSAWAGSTSSSTLVATDRTPRARETGAILPDNGWDQRRRLAPEIRWWTPTCGSRRRASRTGRAGAGRLPASGGENTLWGWQEGRGTGSSDGSSPSIGALHPQNTTGGRRDQQA